MLRFWNSNLRFPRWVTYFIWLNYITGLGIVFNGDYLRSGDYRWVWEILQDIKFFTLFVVFASLFFPLGVFAWKGKAFAKKNGLWLLLAILPILITLMRFGLNVLINN
jgi:hypothetical protein